MEQRERYPAHLRAAGARRSTLRKCANDKLNLVGLLNLEDGERVDRSRIEAAATMTARPGDRRCDRAATPKTRDRLVIHGVCWLAFLGWLDEGDDDRHPHHPEFQAFARWSREERGLSDATVSPNLSARKEADGQIRVIPLRSAALARELRPR